MTRIRGAIIILLLAISTALCSVAVNPGSGHYVTGKVTDADTGAPLPYVVVKSIKKGNSAITDSLGVFRLFLRSGNSLEISSEGYGTAKVKGPIGNDTVRVGLKPSVTELEEFVVKYKRQKYNKHNPASALMERIRSFHDSVAPERLDGYNFDSYEKILIGVADVRGDEKGLWALPVGDKKALVGLIDTMPWTGRKVLNVSIKEKSSVNVYQDGNRKEIVTGTNYDGIDKKFSADYTAVFLSDVMREVDLYNNDIHMMRNAFVSPLSRQGIDFYRYELQDTVLIGNERCVELSFAPSKPEMTGFNGTLYVPVVDSVKYVRRAMMRVPKAANINFIKSMILSQNYKRDSLGKVHKVLDDMYVDFQVVSGTPVFSMRRETRRKNFGYDGRPGYEQYMSAIGNSFTVEGADKMGNLYWEQNRQIPLTRAESRLVGSNSVFRKDKFFYWTETILHILTRNFIPTGNEDNNKFDIGPINTLLSYTRTNGWRMQLGGMTTAKLFPRFFLRGYGAWSFGDHKWKGAIEGEYSFEKRKHHALEFPMNNIKMGFSYDTNQIGMAHSPFGSSTFLGSWRRSVNEYINYAADAYVEYSKEWRNNLSVNFGFRYTRQYESNSVKFKNGFGQTFDHFGQGVLSAAIRWAPNEKFLQTLQSRKLINRDAWILTLRLLYGPKKLLGGKFNILKTEFGMTKTVWLSAYGYIELSANASKIWTQVPFTELYWQDANTSYLYGPRSFSLLNPMEFAMDQYVNWSATYFMNGLIFNHIPFVRKARIREVIGFKGFLGNLSRRNNPRHATNVFEFPDPTAQPMGSTPYMECSVGLENIFRIFSIHYTWRLTYRNRPGISKVGLRWGLHFNF